MEQQDYAELSIGGITWRVVPAFAGALSRDILAGVRSPEMLPAATLIKRSLLRTVHRVELPSGLTIIVKEYKLRDVRQRLKRLLFGPKPLIEWAASRRLRAMGIPASNAIAVGLPVPPSDEVEGYLIVEAPPDAVGMGAYLRQLASADPAATARAHEGFLRELAGFVRHLHDRGIRHHDLHWGNILIRTAAPPDERFLVIDLHRTAVGSSPGPRHRALAIAQLLLSMGGSLAADHARRVAVFLDAYQAAGQPITSPQLLHQRILTAMGRHAARRLRSRARRCLKESSAFCVEVFQGWRIHHRRDHSAADILALWTAHRRNASPAQVPGAYEVKEFPPCGVIARLLRPSPALVAYASAHRAWLEGGGTQAIAAAECLRGPDRGRSFALFLRATP